MASSMASSTALSPAIAPSQLCSGKNGMCASSNVVLPKCVKNGKGKRMNVKCMASIPADRVPDMEKRKLLNLLLLGAIALPSTGMLLPYTYFFVPPGSGGSGGGTVAKDALGNNVIASEWLKTHGPGDRTLTQGLKGDPTYLVVEKDRTLATYAINAVCTHLGCVVPFNSAENKFICPCHGSQYNNQGRVVRGPAPLEMQNAITFDYKKGVKNLIETSPDIKKLPSEFVIPLEENENPVFSSHAQIPLINLSGLDGPSEQRMSTVEAIKSACEIWGFFTIINHGIKESLIEEMMKVVEEFFGLSLEEKMKYACEDVMSPIRYGTSLNTSKKHTLHWRDYFRHYGHPFQDSYHLWPLNPPKYRNVVKEYLEQLWAVAMKIIGAISEGLGLEKGYIEESMGEGLQILAANYYPPCPEPHKTLGLAAHSDHGALTILTQNAVNGLQIKHDHTWIPVHHLPATLLVNIGDCLEILSNGKYKSVEHRATVNAQLTRISIAVGHGPQLSSVIGPASPLIDDEERIQYRPITYKEYIRVQQSSTIRGKSALQVVKTIN